MLLEAHALLLRAFIINKMKVVDIHFGTFLCPKIPQFIALHTCLSRSVPVDMH